MASCLSRSVDFVFSILINMYTVLVHMLWGFPRLKLVRNACGFIKGLRCDDMVHFQDIFNSCVSRLRDEEVALLSIVLWRMLLRN